MKVGTKSVLFGAHCFFIHPVFVFAAWWRLYGFPRDLRLWAAFIVHDWGYWGKGDMDGEEGEKHVELGAKIMHCLFGKVWGDFCRYHSRFYARKEGVRPSRLCVADKYALCLEPWWFYLLRVNMSGEIGEYMAAGNYGAGGKYAGMCVATGTQKKWFRSVVSYLRKWVEEHKDGRKDQWT